MADHRFRPVSGEKPCCDISKKARICLCVVFGLLVVVIIAVVVGIVMWRQPPQHQEWKGAGTTAHFYEIILGRCYTYTQIVRPELGHKDCQKIGKAFTNAFLSKDPCGSTEQDYQPLMELTNQTVPCDKTLLWSKTNELVHEYAWVQRELFTLENTLLGYMADGLRWCGDLGSSEMNYQSCPDRRKDCSNNSVSVFWNTVSKRQYFSYSLDFQLLSHQFNDTVDNDVDLHCSNTDGSICFQNSHLKQNPANGLG
ncbi:ADP-ribosyl cyclase/cyclic ADP-ribose hydrolase 1 isoform X3 [Panthera leo]|uniref:ADP-ribosyl cyclase/cyclic ADP-ribose hydrolase 1 isoform X3 n=1 Tax=Panthera leo TaxID=9689 RepID=UPI0009054CA1|nr:ADP-ribosyl cyclase/cyclic ADP-ribose hydrolase 1 isoform X3 [Panthera leo]